MYLCKFSVYDAFSDCKSVSEAIYNLNLVNVDALEIGVQRPESVNWNKTKLSIIVHMIVSGLQIRRQTTDRSCLIHAFPNIPNSKPEICNNV